MSGYVYLIGTPIFRWYKIGKSRTPSIRITNLGILLPFKIRVIGVWKAHDHTSLEAELHARYASCRVNGEWFSFEKEEVTRLFNLLPEAARVYPKGSLDAVLTFFSNIEEDQYRGNRVLGIRIQKLRGDFTLQEREEKRQEAIRIQKEKKIQKNEYFSILGIEGIPSKSNRHKTFGLRR